MAIQSVTVNPTKYYKYWYFSDHGTYLNQEMDTDSVSIHWNPSDTAPQWLCVTLPDLSETLGNQRLDHIEAVARFSTSSSRTYYYLRALSGQFTEYSGPAPSRTMNAGCPYASASSAMAAPGQNLSLNQFASDATYIQKGYVSDLILRYRAALFELVRTGSESALAYKTLVNSNPLQIIVYYDDENTVNSVIGTVSGPTSGYRNPRSAIDVSWTLTRDTSAYYYCVGGFKTANATLYWKATGDSDWSSISAPADSESLTVPANTFPAASTIQWYISATDTNGHTSTSSTYSFSTADGTAVATPISPSNVMVNGGIANEFTWSVSNTTGQKQSRTVGYWSADPDAVSWNSLFDLSTDATSCEVPANTFSGGTIYWKVQAYNQDGIAGTLSSAVMFSCVAPPAAPTGVTATQVPFATLSWQSEGQRAYEISVDGKVVKKAFGSDVYSYKLTEPLEDGLHSISVRIQGGYGLWSSAATAACNVENNSDATLTLAGTFNIDATLSWERSTGSADPDYWIYRDGIRIGHNDVGIFTDRFVLGDHSYYILEELSDGNYNKSNTVSGRMKSCITRISLLRGSWIDLKLSENSNSAQVFAWSKPATLRHISGAKYPVAELSAYEDRTASYDCAFTTVDAAREFEALRGQVVIIKSRGGEVVVGPMVSLEKTAGDFYLSYRFSIQQIHWEDFVDDADS